jgi:uncharacterized RDD family membrane protein YckC
MNWYYVKDNAQAGPVEQAALEALFRDGKINSNTLVWRAGLETWLPYSQALSGDPPALAGAQATSASLEGPSDAAASPQALRYAGFWIRFLAKLIDGLIMTVLVALPLVAIMASAGLLESPPKDPTQIQATYQFVFEMIYLVVAAAYSILFVGRYEATPGKMACKIKVVDPTGITFGYGRATGRFFAEFLSGLICYLGYIMAAFDDEKRALHDRICKTRVVYK